MNRRKLFGLLAGLPFVPAALKAVPAEPALLTPEGVGFLHGGSTYTIIRTAGSYYTLERGPSLLSVNAVTGTISGVPTTAGEFPFTVRCVAADGRYETQQGTVRL